MFFATTHSLWSVWCGVPIFVARGREENRLFKKSWRAPRIFRASRRANAISKKFVFILSPFLFTVQNAMHCFSFSQRASAKIFAHPRWLFKKFVLHHHSPFIRCCFFWGEQRLARGRLGKARQPLWNTSNAFYHKSFPLLLPLESPRRATYSR